MLPDNDTLPSKLQPLELQLFLNLQLIKNQAALHSPVLLQKLLRLFNELIKTTNNVKQQRSELNVITTLITMNLSNNIYTFYKVGKQKLQHLVFRQYSLLPVT